MSSGARELLPAAAHIGGTGDNIHFERLPSTNKGAKSSKFALAVMNLSSRVFGQRVDPPQDSSSTEGMSGQASIQHSFDGRARFRYLKHVVPMQ